MPTYNVATTDGSGDVPVFDGTLTVPDDGDDVTFEPKPIAVTYWAESSTSLEFNVTILGQSYSFTTSSSDGQTYTGAWGPTGQPGDDGEVTVTKGGGDELFQEKKPYAVQERKPYAG
jgi:hypothetical protein